MPLSSDYLFHYTCSLENICSIILEGMRVSRSTENVSYLQEDYEIDFEAIYGKSQDHQDQDIDYRLSIPMTCFCDIPIRETSQHRNIYGNYALGFSKEWGIERGINPVTYLSPESDYSATIRKMNILTDAFPLNDPNYAIRNAFFKLVSFLKLYEGRYEYDDYENESHRFYDEREWRYIPKGDFIQIAPEKYLNDQAQKVEGSINVSLSELRYLVVEKTKEKAALKDLMKKENIDRPSFWKA